MKWDEARLKDELNQLRMFGDDTTLIECKTAQGGLPENIGETLCAFANLPQVGTIILGVSERLGFQVTGVADPAGLEKALVSTNRNAVSPAPQLTFYHLTLEGKHVIVAEVTPLLDSEKPALYQNQAWIRQGDGDYAMNANDLRMLQISALTSPQSNNFDARILEGTDVTELDADAVQGFLETTRRSRSRLSQIEDDTRLLQIANVTDAEGNLRLGGLYALGFLPQSSEPALGATAAVRLDRSHAAGRNKNLTEIEGPIPSMLHTAMRWIEQNTDTISRYAADGNLRDEPEFPPTAIREVVANALVHRDIGPSLDAGKKVEIRVEKKKLIISNPGGLRGVTVAELEGAPLAKAAVNRQLYEIARYLRMPDGSRVIEGEGGGIREVLTACREARLPRPIFVDTGVQFTVIFPRGSRFTDEENQWLENLSTHLNPTEEDILIHLRKQGAISVDRLLNLYSPMSEHSLHATLRKLEASGIITRMGTTLSLAGVPPTTNPAPPRSSKDLAHLGKNAPAVFGAISTTQERTIKEIIAITGLTASQVRYALESLMKEGYVMMNGGQGQRSTTYRALT